jgi:hypothetical protein
MREALVRALNWIRVRPGGARLGGGEALRRGRRSAIALVGDGLSGELGGRASTHPLPQATAQAATACFVTMHLREKR